jgi:catechol 2,3-dioxygenase-like lactoylglutathione lyase family enzyme
MRILFIAGFAPIVRDPGAARALYADALGIRFEKTVGDYAYTEKMAGAKHFGVWPLSEAADICFGKEEWPADVPVPQATIEFEVDDVAGAARELEARGYALVHPARTEPWKQTVARLLTPDGLLIGVCHTPWLHENKG